MNNNLFSFYSICIMLVSAITFVMSRSNKSNRKGTFFFRCTCVCIFTWGLCTLFLYTVNDIDKAVYLHYIKYIAIAFNPLMFYFHIRSQISDKKYKHAVIALFCVIPVITAVICVIPALFPLLYTNVYFVSLEPARVLQVSYGVWFYVHMAYSYVLLMMCMYELFKSYFLMPKIYRTPVVLMLLAASSIVAFNVLVIFKIFSSAFDITLCGVMISLILFYMALGITSTDNIILTSKDNIYNNISSMIFVLNKERKIIDCNKRTENLLKQLGLPAHKALIGYDKFYENWIEKKQGRVSAYNENIMTFIEDGAEKHYQILNHEVSGGLGYFIEIQEISRVFTISRYIEEAAFYDQLTGILNRNSYMKYIEELKHTVPLGIIMGDVNKLKAVNDEKGHFVGDEFLIDMAKLLVSCCPKNAKVFRIGGDEFVILVQESTETELNAIINDINTACEKTKPSPDNPGKSYGEMSISLGCALRTDESQSVLDLVKEADRLMYQEKYNRRKSKA